MEFLDIFILSFIEGITEFLPISSTGHLIIASHLLKIESVFTTQFNIIIQFGAILAVLAIYWKKFFPIDWKFYFKIAIGFLPSAIIGLLVKDRIDQLLSSVSIVAWALLVGGIVLIIMDRKKPVLILNATTTKATTQFKPKTEPQYLSTAETIPSTTTSLPTNASLQISDLSIKSCLTIGLFQCLAFIPGVSRSAATIIGGLLLGMEKRSATEFSFFLALPTLAGATLLKTIKIYPTIEHSQIVSLVLGLMLSFAFAVLAIRSFVALVSRTEGVFQWFGVYRILLGGLLLIFL